MVWAVKQFWRRFTTNASSFGLFIHFHCISHFLSNLNGTHAHVVKSKLPHIFAIRNGSFVCLISLHQKSVDFSPTSLIANCIQSLNGFRFFRTDIDIMMQCRWLLSIYRLKSNAFDYQMCLLSFIGCSRFSVI